MRKPFLIALVQSTSTVGTATLDPRVDNLARAMESIAEAVKRGAEMVIVGEMYLSATVRMSGYMSASREWSSVNGKSSGACFGHDPE
jgi:predicted amidohydrolase